MEKYAPAPVEEVETVEKRFVMPKMPALTVVQIMLVATIALYAYSARKMNGVVVSSLALTVALLHVYDHMYSVHVLYCMFTRTRTRTCMRRCMCMYLCVCPCALCVHVYVCAYGVYDVCV